MRDLDPSNIRGCAVAIASIMVPRWLTLCNFPLAAESSTPLGALPVALTPLNPTNHRPAYVGVRAKFAIATAIAVGWLALSLWLAVPWMHDLAALANWPLAIFAVGGDIKDRPQLSLQRQGLA